MARRGLTLERAERSQRWARVAVCGGYLSGTTYTSLVVARGLVGAEGRIAVIDAAGGVEVYAGLLDDFDVVTLSDGHPDGFVDALELCARAGVDAIVLDALSCAWAGPGSVLDQVERAKLTARNNVEPWTTVLPQYHRLWQRMRELRCHLVAAVWADDAGKPLLRAESEQLFDVWVTMDATHNATVRSRLLGLDGGMYACPGAELGEAIGEWYAPARLVAERPIAREVSTRATQPAPAVAATPAVSPASSSPQSQAPAPAQRSTRPALDRLRHDADSEPAPVRMVLSSINDDATPLGALAVLGGETLLYLSERKPWPWMRAVREALWPDADTMPTSVRGFLLLAKGTPAIERQALDMWREVALREWASADAARAAVEALVRGELPEGCEPIEGLTKQREPSAQASGDAPAEACAQASSEAPEPSGNPGELPDGPPPVPCAEDGSLLPDGEMPTTSLEHNLFAGEPIEDEELRASVQRAAAEAPVLKPALYGAYHRRLQGGLVGVWLRSALRKLAEGKLELEEHFGASSGWASMVREVPAMAECLPAEAAAIVRAADAQAERWFDGITDGPVQQPASAEASAQASTGSAEPAPAEAPAQASAGDAAATSAGSKTRSDRAEVWQVQAAVKKRPELAPYLRLLDDYSRRGGPLGVAALSGRGDLLFGVEQDKPTDLLLSHGRAKHFAEHIPEWPKTTQPTLLRMAVDWTCGEDAAQAKRVHAEIERAEVSHIRALWKELQRHTTRPARMLVLTKWLERDQSGAA